jgi:hypothetical protein
MSEDGMPSVQGVTRRVTRSQTRDGIRAAVRETSVGEDVIFCKLIRDGVLRHLNPWKLSDLQCVLEMRCFEGLLSDADLKEVYFQRMWGFKEREFVLAGWREMSVRDMKEQIRRARRARLESTYNFYYLPGIEEHLMALRTTEEIMREYGMLAYVPWEIADNAMCGVWALRQVGGVGVENLGGLTFGTRDQCLRYACRAGVDFSIIRSLYESLLGYGFAAGGGMTRAACGGHLGIIEAFIGTLGVDVDTVDGGDWTALMWAAELGLTDIVNALAGTHGANVEAVSLYGRTALLLAARNGHTDIVNILAGTYNANVDGIGDVMDATFEEGRAFMLVARHYIN